MPINGFVMLVQNDMLHDTEQLLEQLSFLDEEATIQDMDMYESSKKSNEINLS